MNFGDRKAYHMKKFAEVCLYNQCIIFIAAATNHVNTNVLMMWQKNTNFYFKICITFSLSPLRNFLHWY